MDERYYRALMYNKSNISQSESTVTVQSINMSTHATVYQYSNDVRVVTREAGVTVR